MTNPPVLGSRLVPSLLVRDLEATLTFYGWLGFARTGVFPDEDAPIWAEVTRDGIALQFYTDPRRVRPPSRCSAAYSTSIRATCAPWLMNSGRLCRSRGVRRSWSTACGNSRFRTRTGITWRLRSRLDW